MTAQTRDVLKTYFETGDKPTQAQFTDLIDSFTSAPNPFVNVMDPTFGAKGDGVTNDAAAIQAAINYASIIGRGVFFPAPAVNYYMGTTGLTVGSRMHIYCDEVALVWSSSFTGTALTLTGNYNIIENLILFMPKSVSAPASSIIGIDIQGPLNELNFVHCEQTSAGGHSPWYTGIKISGINTKIYNCDIFSYDTGIHATGSTSSIFTGNNITAEITASIRLTDCGVFDIIGNDFEGAASYGVWLEVLSAEIASGLIQGNYFEAFTSNVIYLNGSPGKTVKAIAILANEINCGASATNGIFSQYAQGIIVAGNYIKAISNSIFWSTSNQQCIDQNNFFTGSRSVTGLFSADITDGQTLICSAISANSGSTGTTLTNITGLTYPLTLGAIYAFRVYLTGTSTANGGLKLAMANSGSTISCVYTGSQHNGTTNNAETTTTTIGSAVAAATTVFTNIWIEGTINVNAAGNLTAQFAQNASHADMTTINAGGYMRVWRIA